jgi:hypothetical protein
MNDPNTWLDKIFKESLPTLLRDQESNLVSVVRFGSTTQFIKYSTDVDVLLIFRELPHRRERHALVELWENEINSQLLLVSLRGFDMRLSLQLRTLREAKHWSKIYLDMTEHCSIVHDPAGLFAGILEQMKCWIENHGAQKNHFNGMPIWTYPMGPTSVCFV